MKKLLLLFSILFSLQALALKPDRKYQAKPDGFGMDYKEYKIKTEDHATLNVWVCKPGKEADQKITLILAYGDAGNMSYWLQNVSELVKSGFTVVTFDYRGFGESSDFAINNDYLYYNEFATDLETVINWSKKTLSNKQTGIWSLSMGTIMTTLAVQHADVDFIVAEGFVTDPQQVKETLKSLKNKEIILPEHAADFPAVLAKTKGKMLLFAGSQDVVTTVDHSRELLKLNAANKLAEFEGNHLQGFMVLSVEGYGDKYISEIIHFIGK